MTLRSVLRALGWLVSELIPAQAVREARAAVTAPALAEPKQTRQAMARLSPGAQFAFETGYDIGANSAAAAEMFPQHTKYRCP